MEKAIAFCRTCLGKFGNSGAIVRIHAKPLDDIIREYAEPSVPSNERVSVYMTKSKSYVKDTIRYLRDKFGIDKRTAKEMAENTSRAISYNREPACIAANIPLSQAKELTDALFDEYSAEGEIRWQ